MKKILIIMALLLSSYCSAASMYDKEIVVLDQKRNEKVKKVFREMMDRYEEKDLEGFFSYVSEDRFLQDYMTFYEAIEKDMRVYDTLSIDTWIDKISDQGVKRFLYVRWDKRYDSVASNIQIQKLGYSRFLFDEINGKYKLIELAGNNFWGESLPEWREEVPHIAGQEIEVKPDLTVTIEGCILTGTGVGKVSFRLNNIGATPAATGEIEYKVINDIGDTIYTYNGDLDVGSSSEVIEQDNLCIPSAYGVYVDPNNLIDESDETNNMAP